MHVCTIYMYTLWYSWHRLTFLAKYSLRYFTSIDWHLVIKYLIDTWLVFIIVNSVWFLRLFEETSSYIKLTPINSCPDLLIHYDLYICFITKNLVDVWIIIELLSIFLLCNLHFLVSVIVEVNYFIYVFYTYRHIWLNFNLSSFVPFKCFVNTLKGYTWMT